MSLETNTASSSSHPTLGYARGRVWGQGGNSEEEGCPGGRGTSSSWKRKETQRSIIIHEGGSSSLYL